MSRSRSWSALFSIAAIAALAACEGTLVAGGGGDDDDDDPAPADAWQDRLDARRADYGAALRTAALRLTGELPTVAEVEQMTTADAKTRYETRIRGYLDDPRFARQALAFWRDTFRMGGDTALDAAPAFAAAMTTGNRSYLTLLTATTGTCPTVNAQGVVTPADCTNGVTTHAGVLTNPGVMRHFASNLAFRRTRWVQEIFACTAFPAELGTPQPVGDGAASYTAPWPFESIAGTANGGRIDFLDADAVVCANCHATMNHLAPLFARFDDNGTLTAQIAVRPPLPGEPLATFADYLPPGQVTAWRLDRPAADLPALGAAMAADPRIAECAVARAWNWALGRGDIVTTLSTIPSEVIAAQVATFTAGGHKFQDLLFAVFTSDDFTKY